MAIIHDVFSLCKCFFRNFTQNFTQKSPALSRAGDFPVGSRTRCAFYSSYFTPQTLSLEPTALKVITGVPASSFIAQKTPLYSFPP